MWLTVLYQDQLHSILTVHMMEVINILSYNSSVFDVWAVVSNSLSVGTKQDQVTVVAPQPDTVLPDCYISNDMQEYPQLPTDGIYCV